MPSPGTGNFGLSRISPFDIAEKSSPEMSQTKVRGPVWKKYELRAEIAQALDSLLKLSDSGLLLLALGLQQGARSASLCNCPT